MPGHGIKGLPALPGTGASPVTMVDNTYTYDGNANRITKNTLSGKTGFGYDSANRLVRADYPQFSEEYRYDRAGNRTSRHRTGRGSLERSEETYKYDECNRLTVHDITGFRDDGTQESIRRLYTYDMQGNMLSDGDRQYSYDVRNRLAEVRTADGSWQKNHYDGEGLRAELEENGRLVRFIYDGDKAVLEGTDENTIRHIRGYELVSSDSEAAKTYYHYASDELGSITHVTDEDGNVLNRYEYDAFGNFTLKEETVENRFGFAGEQYDPAANLYYLRARFYNPVIGRFIQEDTYYGDGLNLYTYCHNNPVGYVDPSGHGGICQNKYQAIEYLKEKEGLTSKEALEKYREYRSENPDLSPEALKKKIMGEGNAYTETIHWGIHDIEARPEAGGYWGERIPQSNPRVDAFELNINPQNESFYLPHPNGGYVQFENMINNTVQDGKLIISDSSFYHVDDKPGFARSRVLAEAQRQLEAANVANYRVEWLVSDQKAVNQLTALFREQNVDIVVTYYPE